MTTCFSAFAVIDDVLTGGKPAEPNFYVVAAGACFRGTRGVYAWAHKMSKFGYRTIWLSDEDVAGPIFSPQTITLCGRGEPSRWKKDVPRSGCEHTPRTVLRYPDLDRTQAPRSFTCKPNAGESTDQWLLSSCPFQVSGALLRVDKVRERGSRGTRADEGVRPTNFALSPVVDVKNWAGQSTSLMDCQNLGGTEH